MSTERITKYNPKDLALLQSKTIFTNFGKGKHTDHVELHVYSGDNVLESDYNVKSYSVEQAETNQLAPAIKLNIHGDIRSLGYQAGTFGIKYNFLRCLVGDPNNHLYIDEISNDRKEIRLRPVTNDVDLADDFLEFGERIEGSEISAHTFWPDVRLNFGEDTLLLAVNWAVDYDAFPNFPHSIVFKLYQPLPDELEEGDKLWICQSIAEPIQEDIKLTAAERGFASNVLAPPDFSIPAHFDPPTPTGWLSETDILKNGETSVKNSLFQKLYSGSFGDVRINIDFNIPQNVDDSTYTGFKNVVHFGSVVSKLENFKYKIKQLESYDSRIAEVSTDLLGLTHTGATSSYYYQVNKLKWENKKVELLGTFDDFEEHLYYSSQSYVSNSFGQFIPFSWPKISDKTPYRLASVDSTAAQSWFGQIDNPTGDYYKTGVIQSASAYDEFNDNKLINTIPAHIKFSEENDKYVTFVNMVGDNYDQLYLYTKHLLDIHSREFPVYEGIPKKLLEPVLKSFGWQPFQSFDFHDLWSYNFGTDGSGSYGGKLNFTASLHEENQTTLTSTIIGLNGTPPYSFNWSHTPSQNSQTIVQVLPTSSVGVPTVTIIDSTGLKAVASGIVGGPLSQSFFTSSPLNQPVSASNDQQHSSLSQDDISKELWKRILNNLPHVLKTKGTEESIRSIISAYGLPSTILKIHEYGGPQKLPGRHSKSIYDRFSYSLNFDGRSNITGSWSPASSSLGNIRYPNAVEFRFNIPDKTINKKDMVLWNTYSGSAAIWAEHTSSLKTSESGSLYGRINFALRSGSQGPNHQHRYITSSTEWAPIYDNDWWTVILNRRDPGKDNQSLAFTQSANLIDHEGQNLRYDLFCKKTSDFSRFGRINWAVSSSLDISGSLGEPSKSYNRSWGGGNFVSGSNASVIIDESNDLTLKHFLGGATSSYFGDDFLYKSASNDPNRTITGFSGSMQEFRLYLNPISESVFDHHVMSPLTIISRGITSSYDDLLVRWSLGADLAKFDVSHSTIHPGNQPNQSTKFVGPAGTALTTDGYMYGFPHSPGETFGYSQEEERYFTKMPRSIGPAPYSEKIRIEDNKLTGQLHPIMKREHSSFDKNPLDSNKLGVYFSPTDEIDLDIAHELGPFEYDDFVGDPRDTYLKKYTQLKRINSHYWTKHPGNPNFFEFLKMLRYFDDSLFKTVRQLIPARAKAQVGLLVKPHFLERPRILKYPSASLQDYSVRDLPQEQDQTILDGTIGVFNSMSFTGYSAGESGPFTYSGLKEKKSSDNLKGTRIGGFEFSPGIKNAAISKDKFAPTNDLEREKGLDNRTVGELEGDYKYDKFGYDLRGEGSRYIHTTVEFPTGGAGVAEDGAKVWNAYYNRDAWGMTIHTPPNGNIHHHPKYGKVGYDYDNYTASSAGDITDGHVKFGLNRKVTTEIYIPFVSQSRKSFEKKRQLYYYATAFSQSLGKAIPNLHILNWGNAAVLGGTGHPEYDGARAHSGSMPSHSLEESAEYQDFRQTPLMNLYFNGCKLVGSNFNMESKQTVDGGPVVEFYDVSPYKYVAADEGADGRILTAGEGRGETLAQKENQVPIGRRFSSPVGQNLRGATPSPRGRNFNRRG